MNALLLLAAAVCAQDATLAGVVGRVSIKAGGDDRYVAAKAGDSLLFGDTVRAGAKSSAHVVLENGPVVLVRERSTFTLQGTRRSTTVRFKAGEFLVGLKSKLAAGERFRVRTPSAIAAVRGTLFWGRINADKSTDFAALENEVAVTAAKKTVTLKPGQKTSVPFGQAPAEPAPGDLAPDYPRKTFAIDGSLQGLEELLK